MFLSHQLGPFLVAVLVFQMIPGPGTLAILRATANHGLMAGFAAVAGTLLGGLVCMVAAVSGLEAVFRGQPETIHVLRCAGALYLAWMGWRLVFRRPPLNGPVETVAPSLFSHARRSLAVSLTNPKVLLFYFALLPLFFQAPIDAESFATMAGCVTGVSFVYQSALVVVGNTVARWVSSSPSLRTIAPQIAGVAFIGFAVKLFVV